MKENRLDIALRIVVPCYNEEEVIDLFYARVKEVVCKYDYSILFVDDGSTDGTLKKIEDLSLMDGRISYISFSRNFGQQSALKAGYDNSTEYDCVISLDGDLQHPPELIDTLVTKWIEGFDIVNTVRSASDKSPLWRRILAKWFYRFINFISKTRIIPHGPDYRLLDKKVITAVRSVNESNIYLKELIPWLGFRQCEVALDVDMRAAGKSKYSLRTQLSTSIRAITSFSVSPLRIASLTGIVFGMLAFGYGVYSLYIFFFTYRALPGWTSVIASILFIASIQFLLIGIIGEYLGRAFTETKRRPSYIVREQRNLATSNIVLHGPSFLMNDKIKSKQSTQNTEKSIDHSSPFAW